MSLLTAFFLLLFTHLGRTTLLSSTTEMESHDPIEDNSNLTADLRDFLGWKRDTTVRPYSGPGAVSAPTSFSDDTNIPGSISFLATSTVIPAAATSKLLSTSTSAQETSSVPMSEHSTIVGDLLSLLITDSTTSVSETTTTTVTTFLRKPDDWDQWWTSRSSVFTGFSTNEQATVTQLRSNSSTATVTTLGFYTVSEAANGSLTAFASVSKSAGSSVTFMESSSSSTTTSSDPAPLPNSTSTPQYRGINVINHSQFRADQWKTAMEWNMAFHNVHNMPNNLNAVRLYSTTDGDARHLREALSVIHGHNLSIHAGVWSGGDDHVARFEVEKTALDEALSEFGCAKIVAVSVGNEDIYSSHRTDVTPSPLKDVMLLVNQVREIREVLDRRNCSSVKVTHADTFGDWLNISFTEPLIREVDFLTVNIFPFWSATHIDEAAAKFWTNLNETKAMANHYGKEVWIGETGWPREGLPVKAATPSVENMRKYWDQVGCKLLKTVNAFWYTEWDTSTNGPSFGLLTPNGTSVVGDLSC